MPLISSFHSKVIGETKFHNNGKCLEGSEIEKKNVVQGTGKLILCENCAQLTRTKK